MFKNGDYIVLTEGSHNEQFKLDHVYLQTGNDHFIQVEKDSAGNHRNMWFNHPFDKSEKNDWRYATDAEIKEYNANKGPVPAGKVAQFKKGEYIVCLVGHSGSSIVQEDIVVDNLVALWDTNTGRALIDRWKQLVDYQDTIIHFAA